MGFWEGFTLVRDFLWRGPLLVLLPAAGLLMTCKLRFLQLRRLPLAFRLLLQREEPGARRKGEVSPFAALCTALSATIGTGNICGVATAVSILAGGPGALFWMWLSALLGMAVKYTEGYLAIRFRVTLPDGQRRGGPFYYMERGLGKPWLGRLFALCTALAGVLGIGTMTQMSGIIQAAETMLGTGRQLSLFGGRYSLVRVACGVIVGILATLVIWGGAQRIARAATLIVPLMAGLYVGASGLILITHAQELPGALRLIIESAFGLRAAAGGGAAAILLAMQNGVARGVFSNEAGLGSSPIAAGASGTDNPVKQGLITMTGTFIDTLLLCTMTGLVLIVMGSWRNTALEGAAMTLDAFARGLWFLPPGVSDGILAVSLTAFAFTTILGWCFYGERSVEYLTGNRFPGAAKAYRAAYLLTVFLAPYLSAAAIWTTADVLNAMMALPNLIAIFGLSGLVSRETMRRFTSGHTSRTFAVTSTHRNSSL